MLKAIRFWSTAGLCVVAAACGQQRETRNPTSEASNASEGKAKPTAEVTLKVKPEPEPKVETEPPTAEKAEGAGAPQDKTEVETQSAQASKTPQEQASPERSVAEICEKLTRRATEKCTKQVSGFYQSSCNHYLQKPGPCDEQLRLALECQYKAAEEVLCAHGADHNCSQVNRELKLCQRGTAPAEQTTAEDDHTLPSSWEQIQDSELGFTVAMPSGATLDTEGKRRTWKAEEGGISYYVAVLAVPSEKLDNRAFVRTVTAYVGERCQLGLKLNGHLELKGTTVVQYHSACPDKTEWHGMLHFWNGKVVSTGLHAPAGATGVREPFYYSFLITK